MPRITYIEFDGTEHQIDVENGYTVMEGAVRNGVPGIDADCGGACACATCHVYIDPAWRDRTGAPGEVEADMLEFGQGVAEGSRLSCQIAVRPELDGLIVRLPETQH
ncbi:MAG: 2Fe-2S iron-sulfur cluster-binding protein [Novosphingobium sp.]